MKIYTKTGDQGQTSLFGGERVLKSHPRVSVYGTLDEANSMIGLALSQSGSDEGLRALRSALVRIQNELFQIGAELATPPGKKLSVAIIHVSQVNALEREIDQMEAELTPLTQFILPGGSLFASSLHLARTITRRAERQCVELTKTETVRDEIIQYLNRLSDFLFVAARFANLKTGVQDTPWISR